MKRNYPNAPFERYVDDAIIHCRTETETTDILKNLNKRLTECKLELHPLKTKIVYCKDRDRTREYPSTQFDFLGYTFRGMFIKDKLGRLQINFLPGVSKKSSKAFREKLRGLKIHSFTGSKIDRLAEILNPMIRGWLNYFEKYNRSMVKHTMDWINRSLVKWATCKYKRFRSHSERAKDWLKGLVKREPNMFPHWALGILP